MKKVTLIIALTLGVMSCKKEEVTEVNNVTYTNVMNYESNLPFYSVKQYSDTLVCDAEGLKYEYLKISDTQWKSNRVYWKSTNTWTWWQTGQNAYVSNNTLHFPL